MLCLKARFEGQTLSFPLPIEPVNLGSAPGSVIRLPFPGVSRLHAVVEPVAGGVALRDLGSRNGLFVGGRRRREALLAPGDEVSIGSTSITLEETATSDVELGLHVEVRAAGSPGGGGSVGTDTGSASRLQAGRGAEDALRLVRECEAARDEGGLDESTVLPRAAAVLNATGITLWEREEGGAATVTAAWGEAPGEDETDGQPHLVWRAPRGRGKGPPGEAGLSASFASAEAAAAPWRADLVAYLGRVLTGIPRRRPLSSAGRPPESALVLPPGMVAGSSPLMRDLLAQVRAAAGSAIDILVTGETGTGKELVARMIHGSGGGRTGKLVTVNCAAIPAELLEADLFGVHGRVATGVDPRPGRLLLADHGTVFLDEVGELAPPLQGKFLRFLQEREVHAVGASVPRQVDVRVVAATNRDLLDDVRRGRFRADLYYRLRGLELRVPSLRERKEDIPELALAFVRRAVAASGKEVRGITRKALAALVAHDWPGNVRELEADLRRAVLLCPPGGSLGMEHLSPACADHGSARETSLDPRHHLAGEEQRILERVLEEAGGNRTEAARRLGLKRTTFLMRLRRGVSPPRHDE